VTGDCFFARAPAAEQSDFSGTADTARLPYLIAFGRARPVGPVDE